MGNTTFFPGIDGCCDDFVNFFRRPELLDHGRSGKPRKKNSRRGRSIIERVIQGFKPCDEGWVVGNFGAREAANRELENKLCEESVRGNQGVNYHDTNLIHLVEGVKFSGWPPALHHPPCVFQEVWQH